MSNTAGTAVEATTVVWHYCHVCFKAQPQLPWRETAMRVPAQQVGPHQAANSWFRPAQSQGLVLRAQQHNIFTYQYWNWSVEPGGGCPTGNYLLTPLQLLPPQQPLSLSFLPFLLHSFLIFQSKIPQASLLPAMLKFSLLPSYFAFLFLFEMSSCGIPYH